MEHKVWNSCYRVHHHYDPIKIMAFTFMIFHLSLAKSIPSDPCSAECLSLNANDNSSEEETPSQRFQVCYSENTPFGQVYDKKRERCYNLLEQGPCPSGELLSMNMAHNSVICLRNCGGRKENTGNREEWHSKWRNGDCARHHTDITADEESQQETSENEGDADDGDASVEANGNDEDRDDDAGDEGDDDDDGHEKSNEEGGDDKDNPDSLEKHDDTDNEDKSK